MHEKSHFGFFLSLPLLTAMSLTSFSLISHVSHFFLITSCLLAFSFFLVTLFLSPTSLSSILSLSLSRHDSAALSFFLLLQVLVLPLSKSNSLELAYSNKGHCKQNKFWILHGASQTDSRRDSLEPTGNNKKSFHLHSFSFKTVTWSPMNSIQLAVVDFAGELFACLTAFE